MPKHDPRVASCIYVVTRQLSLRLPGPPRWIDYVESTSLIGSTASRALYFAAGYSVGLVAPRIKPATECQQTYGEFETDSLIHTISIGVLTPLDHFRIIPVRVWWLCEAVPDSSEQICDSIGRFVRRFEVVSSAIS